jgi:tetratricopeptide (TPR) repeat protein
MDFLAYNSRAAIWYAKGDLGRAIKDLDESIKLSIRLNKSAQVIAATYAARANFWTKIRNYGKAIQDYDEVLRLNPNELPSYNTLAWLLATCSQQTFRDGGKAIKLATRACELSSWKSGAHLDTLAAAYAEVGQFDTAIRYQGQALQDPTYAGGRGDVLRQRLELYKQNRPYRQPN